MTELWKKIHQGNFEFPMSKLSNGILENLQKWSKKSPVSPFFPWNFPWEIPPQHQVVVVFGVTSSWWLGQAPSKLCEDSSVDERRALGDRFGWDLPSGSLTQLQKITMLLMGKSTISMAIFNSYLYVDQAGQLEFFIWDFCGLIHKV